MKSIKLIAASLAAIVLYVSSVAFSPVNQKADTRKIIFETNDMSEVSRVKDLLTKEHLMEVKELSAFVRIRISLKNKKEGTEIDISGGS